MPPYNHVVHSPLWAAVGGHAEARTLELLAQQLERRRRSSDAQNADEIGAAAASHNVVQHRRHSAAGSQHGVAHQDAVLWRKPGGQFVQVLLWLRGTASLSAIHSDACTAVQIERGLLVSGSSVSEINEARAT